MSLDIMLTIPDTCPHCGAVRGGDREVYSANITHNLNRMAAEAGIYEAVWRPEEVGISKADQLVQPLVDGLAAMYADPPRFRRFNDPGGWGMYEHFMPWLEKYLAACRKWPDAAVSVSR